AVGLAALVHGGIAACSDSMPDIALLVLEAAENAPDASRLRAGSGDRIEADNLDPPAIVIGADDLAVDHDRRVEIEDGDILGEARRDPGKLVGIRARRRYGRHLHLCLGDVREQFLAGGPDFPAIGELELGTVDAG